MSLLKKLLNKAYDSDGSLTTTLAALIGYKSPSAIYKFIREENRKLEDFEGILKIVKYVHPERETEIMSDYSEHIDANKNTCRFMLEYLACNRKLEAMKKLIIRMESGSNNENKAWAKTYNFLYIWLIDTDYKIDLDDYLNKLNDLNVDNIPQLRILKNILKCYVLNQKKFHKQVSELSHEVKIYIEEMEECFLKNIYQVRLNELFSIVNLWVSFDCEGAIQYASKVIKAEASSSFTAYAYLIIGRSHFFTSYEDAKNSLNKSKEIYASVGRVEDSKYLGAIVESLDIYWGKKTDCDYCTIENKLYQQVKTSPEKITEELDKYASELGEEYYLLLKGINNNDNEMLFKAMVLYLKNGDAFSSNFAKVEMTKRGFPESMLKELLKIHAF